MDQDVNQPPAPAAADQDAALGVTTTVTQADIVYLRAMGRLGEYAVVYRVWREQAGGGFGDQSKNPMTWGVLVYVDGQLARLYSTRGAGREWSNLDRLEKWLRSQGFWYWWTRNDLEPLGEEFAEPGADEPVAVEAGVPDSDLPSEHRDEVSDVLAVEPAGAPNDGITTVPLGIPKLDP